MLASSATKAADTCGTWLMAQAFLAFCVMRITAPGPVERIVATWYRVGDMDATGGAGVKLATMRARLRGNDRAAVALHLSTVDGDPAPIARFLDAAGGPRALSAVATEPR